jgi:O-antigen ligase
MSLSASLPVIRMFLAVAGYGLWAYVSSQGAEAPRWLWTMGIAGVALPWVWHTLAEGWRLWAPRLEIPLLLLMVGGGLGVASAYDRGVAMGRMGLMISAIGVSFAIARLTSRRQLNVLLVFLVLVEAAMTVYYIVSADWSVLPVKYPMLAWLTEAIARVLPQLGASALNGNNAGGVLAAFLPYNLVLIAGSAQAAGRGARLWRVLWIALTALACLGLLLSSSRGAWMAVAIVGGLWLVWRQLGWRLAGAGLDEREAWRLRTRIILGLALAGVIFGLLLVYAVLAARLPGYGTLSGRLTIFARALLLARDYALTGAGLGEFNIQHSIYTLLIHVGHTDHAHNVWLDLLVDQGLVGLGLFVWFVWACLYSGWRWQRHAPPEAQWVLQASLASLLALVLHGLVDDVFYRGYLYVFVAFAVGPMLAQARWLEQAGLYSIRRRRRAAASRQGLAPAVVLAGLAVMVLVGWRPLLGTLYANLGAVAQARVELNVYDETCFDQLSMDEVRQQENLDVAISRFQRAVALDPANATARQRLASIALARGDYDLALEQMEAAWTYGHRDAVTRLLLGDALVAHGQVERAAELIEGIELETERLHGQAWSRYWVNGDAGRAYDAWDAVLRIEPGDAHAQYWRDEATKRLAAKAGGS